mmetsp:Transcript_272/g.1054  ORF Transcript_272/g.1054 Transcript_272/m.1054 type:complete len:211 (-) Transcript_272:779-1411(-)
MRGTGSAKNLTSGPRPTSPRPARPGRRLYGCGGPMGRFSSGASRRRRRRSRASSTSSKSTRPTATSTLRRRRRHGMPPRRRLLLLSAHRRLVPLGRRLPPKTTPPPLRLRRAGPGRGRPASPSPTPFPASGSAPKRRPSLIWASTPTCPSSSSTSTRDRRDCAVVVGRHPSRLLWRRRSSTPVVCGARRQKPSSQLIMTLEFARGGFWSV